MNPDQFVPGFSLIVAFIVLSLAGMLAIRKQLGLTWLKQHQEVVGHMLAVSGTLYAVILGLLVVDAMQTFQNSRNLVDTEANALADIYLLAEELPKEPARRIHTLCKSYAEEVIEHQWPMMAAGHVDRTARQLVIKLVREVDHFQPKTENEKSIHPMLIQKVFDLRDNRRARATVAENGIPIAEWVVLVIGALITMIFSYFFAPESRRTHAVITFMVSLMIALNLYLLILFGSPFAGDMVVQPVSFRTNLELFSHLEGTSPPD